MRRSSGSVIAPVLWFAVTTLAACGGGSGPTGGQGGAQDGNAGGNNGGSVTLRWSAPTTNTDGSCHAGLSGYIVSYGPESGNYSHQFTIAAGAVTCADSGVNTACGHLMTCTYKVTGVATGQWFFAMNAYDGNGASSPPSNEASVTVN